MLYLELVVLLGFILLGVRLGGMAVGFTGGMGVIVLTLLGLKAGAIPWDVILIIAAVISAITALQLAGGLDYLVLLATKFLRRHPKHITLLAPVVTWGMTVCAGTGHTAFSMIPVIVEVAKKENIRPCVPLSISVVASQLGITASPVSAAVVFMASDAALGGIGISYPVLLLIWLPTTLLASVLTGLILNLCCRLDLSKDPYYLARKAQLKEVGNAAPQAETELKPYARRSLLIFLCGMVMVVCYATAISNNIGLIKPTAVVGYEKVYEHTNPQLFSSLVQENAKSDSGVQSIQIQEDSNLGRYVNKPVLGFVLTRDHAIISFMLAVATIIVLCCRLDVSLLPDTTIFKNGMSACVCVMGVAWLGDTFVSNHIEEIEALAVRFVIDHPPILAVALFFASTLLYSQAATAKALMPTMIAALGITASNPEHAYIIVASFPALSALFVLPTYPTLIGAVNMDYTGTTRIGNMLFNHSFIIPGVLAISLAVMLGFILAPLLL
ncbi:MAG: anaerobic C4-dicarboxylate transporter [Succinivibrio sp.]|nr:anaerobic C4-dicarboxylate transporter [Succinivibrio sp.]